MKALWLLPSGESHGFDQSSRFYIVDGIQCLSHGERLLFLQCPTPTAGATPEKWVSAAVASIRAHFGYRAIGLGADGIRYSARGLG